MISQERARELLAKAVELNPFVSVEDIADALTNNEAKIWLFDKSFIVTEITDNKSTKTRTISVVAAGGDLQEIADEMRPSLEIWAKKQGCTHVEVTGRRGWVRALKSQGYSELSTTVVKEI